ncbi:MAG: Ldh family oxidoreductase [Rhodospirillales bacterium]
MTKISSDELHNLCTDALTAAGFSDDNAQALARQTVLTEELGQPIVGVLHMFYYVDGVRDGRINGMAEPTITTPAPAIIHVDGNEGLPQAGFDKVFEDIVAKARKLGMAMFLHRNATLCGSLGTFTLRLAERGLVGFAATNGSPLVAGSGGTKPVFGTTPTSFAAPQADGPPLLIDQSSSATAFVNIKAAAGRGEAIPKGWALDADGNPTTNPDDAIKGALLPFGGQRGGNIALMAEILSAGLSGGNWSLDAGSFVRGDRCPGTGLFVMAIDPEPAAHGFAKRLGSQLRRLADDYGVHIPGLSKARIRTRAKSDGIEIDDELLKRLKDISAGA